MKLRNTFYFSLSFSLLLCLPMQAQSNPKPGPVPTASPVNASPAKPTILPSAEEQRFFMTMSQAIEIALAQNHDILLAQNRIEDARLQLTETGATGLPQLTATASYARQEPIVSTQQTDTAGAGGAGLGGNPQFAAFLGTASVNTFQTNITLSQTLFAGFRIVDGIRLSNINVDMVNQGLRQTQQNVAYQVTNAYFNALRSWEMVELDKESLNQSREQVRTAEARLRAGTAVKLDLLQTQSQVIQLQQRLSQNLNSYEKSKMSLNQVMGRDTNHPLVLNTLASVSHQAIDPEQGLQAAIENRPDLRQLRLQREMNELNATIQARATWPTLAAQVRYSLQDQAVVNGNSNNTQNINYALNLNWPIFDGLAAQAKAQRAQKSAEQARVSLDQVQQQVILNINQAFLDIDEATERELMARAGVEVARESLRVAQVSYREGVGVILDVINSQLTVQQAANALITARYDLNTRKAKLYQTLGLDITEFLR